MPMHLTHLTHTHTHILAEDSEVVVVKTIQLGCSIFSCCDLLVVRDVHSLRGFWRHSQHLCLHMKKDPFYSQRKRQTGRQTAQIRGKLKARLGSCALESVCMQVIFSTRVCQDAQPATFFYSFWLMVRQRRDTHTHAPYAAAAVAVRF